MPSGVSVSATSRLKKDYAKLLKEPVPFMKAAPRDDNILEWRYIIFGAPKTPYEGGLYHGKLVFPPDFPFKPPAIYMITPNGRFQVNTRLCLSISDYHPDTWNPAWTVSTIITGLLSFMNDNHPTLGSVSMSDDERRKLARKSKPFNLKDEMFCLLFPDEAEMIRKELTEIEAAVDEASLREQEERAKSRDSCTSMGAENSDKSSPTFRNAEASSGLSTLVSNIIVVAGVVLLAFAVRYVIQAANEQEQFK